MSIYTAAFTVYSYHFHKWISDNRWMRATRNLPLRRVYAGFMVLLFILSIGATIAQPYLPKKSYALSSKARNILPEKNARLAKDLKFDTAKGTYAYNAGLT